MNPVLNLLNVFCILFLGQQENEMLETELYNDYKDVMQRYYSEGKLNLLDEFTDLLIQHTAIPPEGRDYIEKIQLAVQLEMHVDELKTINQKYLSNWTKINIISLYSFVKTVKVLQVVYRLYVSMI